MSGQIFHGFHAVRELLKHQAGHVAQVLVQAGHKNKRMEIILSLATQQGIQILETDKADLDKKTDGKHQGVIAVIKRGSAASDNMLSEQDMYEHIKSLTSPFLLILDGVTDPHNLGACLRTANAAGVDVVITPKDKSATLNQTVRKVASGAAESIQLVTVTNLARCLEKLKAVGVWIIGTDDKAKISLYRQDFRGPLALVMGSEGSGLRRLTREKCDYLISIPMAGDLSSLNVSVATGVALFEAIRQRKSE